MNVLMPQLGETVAEGTVANWHKKVGDTVAVDEILFDVETDKVSMEVPSLEAGVITKILVPAGTTVEVGTVLAVIEGGAAAVSGPPAARAAAPSLAPAQSTAAPAGRVQPFTRIRRLTAEHMVGSKATSPHVLQAVEVDFFRVDQVRKIVRDAFKAKHGHSLTYLPFIAHAVCQALHDFPNLNSSVQGDGLVLHEHVNLSVAVDLGPEGLVAPAIKRAEQLSVVQLATAINDLSARARSGQIGRAHV